MPEPQIWDILTRDHEVITKLVDELVWRDEAPAREVLRRLVCEVTAHFRAEEAVFHGHLLHDERARAHVVEGLDEHKRIDAALVDLERLPVGDELWPARRAAIADLLRSHFRAEESDLFSLARQCLSPAQAKEIAGKYVAERTRIRADLVCFNQPCR